MKDKFPEMTKMTNQADRYLLAGGPPQLNIKMRKIFFYFFIIVALISFIGCSSIKVGSSSEQTSFINSTDFNIAHKKNGTDAFIKNCEKDTSPNISGKYTSKECDGHIYGNSYPFLALETAPLFFGDSNVGVTSWVNLYKETEARLFNFHCPMDPQPNPHQLV